MLIFSGLFPNGFYIQSSGDSWVASLLFLLGIDSFSKISGKGSSVQAIIVKETVSLRGTPFRKGYVRAVL